MAAVFHRSSSEAAPFFVPLFPKFRGPRGAYNSVCAFFPHARMRSSLNLAVTDLCLHLHAASRNDYVFPLLTTMLFSPYLFRYLHTSSSPFFRVLHVVYNCVRYPSMCRV